MTREVVLARLHDCGDLDSVSDWEAGKLYNALSPERSTDYVHQGTYSMKLGIDADLHALGRGWWLVNKSWNLSGYLKDWFYLQVYFETLAYLNPDVSGKAFYVWLGSSSSDYGYWAFAKSELQVGWNELKCDLDVPTVSAGTPDYSALDYSWLGIYSFAGNGTDFSAWVDRIQIVKQIAAEHDALVRSQHKSSKGSGHRWKNCAVCGTKAAQGEMIRQDGLLKCPECVDDLTHRHYHREVLKRLKDDRERPTDPGLGIISD